MKTTYEIVNILWVRLKACAPLATDITKITGGFYKQLRPTGSDKEDVVINGLGINNEQLQRGIFNVNFHVPNLIVNPGTTQDTRQPNLPRLKQLTEFAIACLKDVWIDDYAYDVQQQNLFEDEESFEHYSNIRLEFIAINI